jgi:iron(III) transport system substrate-binding protein
MRTKNSFHRLIWPALLLIAAIAAPRLWQSRHSDQSLLTVYCAHDSIFADSILKDFAAQTGIRVQVRYDEEASKSLGLTNLIIAEKERPRCDVFWNNQTLGTIRLKQEGLLAPCDPGMFSHIPTQFKDPDHQWAGFAARLRVYIVNTDLMPATDEAIQTALEAASLRSVAIAVPLFGTTLSHYSVLCDQLGFEPLQAWHKSLHDRGIREARGNGAVRDLVAEGACSLGFTDTDDVFAAIDAGKPVAMRPIRLASGQTICLPNSVAVLRNCPHPENAEKLMRYLLSPEVELALARSSSRQIPLSPVDTSLLPADVRQLMEWAADGVSLEGAARHDRTVVEWLSKEYTGR